MLPDDRRGLARRLRILRQVQRDALGERLRRDRQRDEVDCAAPHRFDRGRHVAVGGEEERRRTMRLEPLEQAEAIQTGHPQVRDHEVDRRPLQQGERLQAVGRLEHSVAEIVELLAQHLSHGLAVVDDEDLYRWATHPPLSMLPPSHARPFWTARGRRLK
jgi:hypothetical protein